MAVVDNVLTLVHPTNLALRLAFVSVQPAEGQTGAGAPRYVVMVARGPRRTGLTDSRMYGPFGEAEAVGAFATVKEGLVAEGYLPAGTAQLLADLATKSPKKRARAAIKAGRRQDATALPALLERAQKPKDDISSVVLALARITPAAPPAADVAAAVVAVVRSEAERKLLSRRRAGVEALRLLPDPEGLAAAALRAKARLPAPVQTALDEQAPASRLVDLVLAEADNDRGTAADTLYELGLPATVAAARQLFTRLDVSKPYVWRYCKSVLKRAIIRDDAETYGLLIHAVEKRSRTAKPKKATIKSGLDGEVKELVIFSKPTVNWMRRMVGRHLRRVAKDRPADYCRQAAWCVIPYQDSDDVNPTKKKPAFGDSYLLGRVLMAKSKRLVLQQRRLTWQWKNTPGSPPKLVPPPAPVKMTLAEKIAAFVKKKPNLTVVTSPPGSGPPLAPPPSTQLEPAADRVDFPALWRAPAAGPALVLLCCRGRHHLVREFAKSALDGNPALLQQAQAADLVAMLASPDEGLAERAENEVLRRFADGTVDLALLLALAETPVPRAQVLAEAGLTASAHLWSADVPALLALLLLPASPVRQTALGLVQAAAPSWTPALRQALVQALVDALDRAEPSEDAFSGLAALAALLAPELGRLPTPQLLSLLKRHEAGAVAAAAAWSSLASSAPGSSLWELLGAPALIELGTSPKTSSRALAIQALDSVRGAGVLPWLHPVLELAEVEWAPVRQAAAQALATLPLQGLDLAQLMGVLDSTWPEAQGAGQALLQRLMADEAPAIDVHDVLVRLFQHPHQNQRRFVVDLAIQHLKPGYVRLAQMESLAKAVLLDTKPDRPARRRLMGFLLERGQKDEAQAEFVSGLLGDVVRSRTQEPRDDALAALAILASQYPGLAAIDGVQFFAEGSAAR